VYKFLQTQKFPKSLYFAWINFGEWLNLKNFGNINSCEWVIFRILH